MEALPNEAWVETLSNKAWIDKGRSQSEQSHECAIIYVTSNL